MDAKLSKIQGKGATLLRGEFPAEVEDRRGEMTDNDAIGDACNQLNDLMATMGKLAEGSAMFGDDAPANAAAIFEDDVAELDELPDLNDLDMAALDAPAGLDDGSMSNALSNIAAAPAEDAPIGQDIDLGDDPIEVAAPVAEKADLEDLIAAPEEAADPAPAAEDTAQVEEPVALEEEAPTVELVAETSEDAQGKDSIEDISLDEEPEALVAPEPVAAADPEPFTMDLDEEPAQEEPEPETVLSDPTPAVDPLFANIENAVSEDKGNFGFVEDSQESVTDFLAGDVAQEGDTGQEDANEADAADQGLSFDAPKPSWAQSMDDDLAIPGVSYSDDEDDLAALDEYAGESEQAALDEFAAESERAALDELATDDAPGWLNPEAEATTEASEVPSWGAPETPPAEWTAPEVQQAEEPGEDDMPAVKETTMKDETPATPDWANVVADEDAVEEEAPTPAAATANGNEAPAKKGLPVKLMGGVAAAAVLAVAGAYTYLTMAGTGPIAPKASAPQVATAPAPAPVANPAPVQAPAAAKVVTPAPQVAQEAVSPDVVDLPVVDLASDEGGTFDMTDPAIAGDPALGSGNIAGPDFANLDLDPAPVLPDMPSIDEAPALNEDPMGLETAEAPAIAGEVPVFDDLILTDDEVAVDAPVDVAALRAELDGEFASEEEIAALEARLKEVIDILDDRTIQQSTAMKDLQDEVARKYAEAQQQRDATEEKATRAVTLATAQTDLAATILGVQGDIKALGASVRDMSSRLAALELNEPADRVAVERQMEQLTRKINKIAREVNVVAKDLLIKQSAGLQAKVGSLSATSAASARNATASLYDSVSKTPRPAPRPEPSYPATLKVGDVLEGHGEIIEIRRVEDGSRMIRTLNGTIMAPAN